MAVRIEVIAEINDRQVQRQADQLADDLERGGVKAADKWGQGFSEGITRQSPKVQKALADVENATIRVAQAQREVNKTQNDSKSEAHIRNVERLTIARNNEAKAHRAASSAMRDATNEFGVADSAFRGLTDSITTNIAGLTSLGRVGPVALLALTEALYETAQVAVTASQALALLPAVAAAAGAGIGTLQLATAGFGQAIKDIRDVKKFNDDLTALAPNAQAAALAMRDLLPEFDRVQQAAQQNFFAGFDQTISNLSTTLGPGIEKLVGGIATSFNQGLSGVANTLMTPDNLSAINGIMDNIGQAFQNAAPAAQSFSQALIDITSVGASFLPDLGTSIANIAQEFANWIRDMRDSGKLKEFIQQGIDACRELLGTLKDIGVFIYDVFGGASQNTVQAWRNKIQDTLNTIGPILDTINLGMKLFNTEIGDSGKTLNDLLNPLTAIRDLVNSIRWFFDPNYRAQDSALQAATDKLNAERAKHHLPPVDTSGTPIPGGTAPGAFDSNGLFDSSNPDGSGPRRLLPPSRSGGIGRGTVPLLMPSGPDWSGGHGMFYSPGTNLPKDKKPSESDRRDAIIAGLDPSLYRVDPYAGMPAGAPHGPMPGGGYGVTDPQALLEADHKVQSQAHDLEEAKKKRLALERDNTATAQDIEKAKWDELEQGWQLQSAQADLVKAQKGKTKDLSNAFGELGAALDKDLGFSKGLPGLADNLVRFLASLAAAPLLGQLEGTKMAAEAQGQPTGGFGLMGILGAQGAFGSLFGGGSGNTPGGLPGATPGGLPSTASGAPVGSKLPGESDRDFAHRVMMPFWQSQGLTVGDHAADQHHEHQNGALDIMVPNIATGQEVLQQVLSDPNVYGAIFNNKTYGYGHGTTPQDYGSTGSPTDKHEDHVHAFYKPGNPGNINPNGAPIAFGGAGMPGALGGSGVVPVYVTNMGGGGMGAPGAGAVGPPGMFSSGAGGPLPGPGQGGLSPQQWNLIAGAESSGDWKINHGEGNDVTGGLQISTPTWISHGGGAYGKKAMDATPEQQMEIANKILADQGAGAWPTTSKNHPEWFRPGGVATPGPTTGGSPAGIPWKGSGFAPGAAGGSGEHVAPTPTTYATGPAAGTPLQYRADGSPIPWQEALPPTVPGGGTAGPMPLTPINPFGPRPGPPGLPNVSGSVLVPGAASSEPNSGAGINSGIGPSIILDPAAQGTQNQGPLPIPGVPWVPAIGGGPGVVGASPPPGQIGPFPVPGSVAATQGGLGASALTPLTNGQGPTAGAQWAPGQGPTKIGGAAPPGSISPGGGGIGMTPGGTLDTAMSLAGAGLDLLAPGAGQAAQTGIKLANRAIQYAGQLAGIGVSGLMETFLPTGGSELANNSWFTRLAGAAAGAAPALPNVAGGKQGKDGQNGQPPGPLTPEDAAKYAAGADKGAQGNNVNVQYDVHGQTEDQNGKSLAWHLGQAALPAGVH